MKISLDVSAEIWVTLVLGSIPIAIGILTFGQTTLSRTRKNIMGVLIGGAVLLTLAPFAHIGDASEDPPSTDSFSFDDPLNPIPRCASFSGTGEVPDGWTLWLTVRDPKKNYHFDSPAATGLSGNGWKADHISVGGEQQTGQPFEINAVLVDEKTSNFLSSSTNYTGHGVLPPKAIIAAKTSLHRGSDAKPCPS